ncbi:MULTISPECIES: FG-GAP-like repeat-containing protein [Niastella]|uniref:VCBS repeat-containing protein n=1 Tax=Niastella soli TaxID=2821487 RepID=A0ABS3Z3S9_9BACT|nr:FG-GAP-like repeat-containing protein [Niastella soli]MBO9204814.1 VCBS repeat-containing protein [Niastella soli]
MLCSELKKVFHRFPVILLAVLFSSPLFAQPSISSISPLAAPAGATVVIIGSNFSTTATNNIVFIGAMRAVVTAATTGSLTVTVPAGATYSYITVTTNGLTAYSRLPFNIISGTNLTPASYAKRDFQYGFLSNTNFLGLVASDVNVDGYPDLVVANKGGSCISVFNNSRIPGSTFMYETAWSTQYGLEGLAMGDINGDGKPDIAHTSIATKEFSAYLNIVTPLAFTFNRFDFPAGPSSIPFGAAINDVDGDGKPDLVVADGNRIVDPVTNTSHGTISVYLNTCPFGTTWWPTFAPAVTYNTGDNPHEVFIGDMDGDGKPDIAVTNNGSASVSVFRNSSTPGSVAFSGRKDYVTGSNPEVISMGDLNGDGKVDMAVSNFASSTVSLFTNTSTTGAISFGSKQDLMVNSPLGIAIADVTGDAKPDLVAAAYTAAAVSVFENTTIGGFLSFAPKMDYAAGNTPAYVTVVDADIDGIPEICVTNGSAISFLKRAPLVLTVELGNDTTLCQGDSLVLTARNQPRGTTYLWNTGSADSSITVKQSGAYSVTVTNGKSTASDAINITFKPSPVFNLGNDIELCEGEKRLLQPVSASTYLWQNGSHADSMVITQAGTYWLQAQKDGCTASDTLHVSYKPAPPFSLNNDTAICRGSAITLDAYSANATYIWNNGASTESIKTDLAGTYWVTVTGNNGCTATDTTHVEYLVLNAYLGNDTTLCDGMTIVLKPVARNASVVWQDGSNGATFTVTQPGTYKVAITNQCETAGDEITIKRGLCELFMPNAFTPNRDGVNDVFRVKDHAFIKSFDMQIFNRWGQLVYKSKDAGSGWDGTLNGLIQPAGNYIWMIVLTDHEGNRKQFKGTVLLIQ